MIEKLVAIFALFAIAVIPLRSALAEDKEHGGETRQFRLGELALRITGLSANGGYLLKFSKGEEELFAGECAFETHQPEIVSNNPLPHCRMLLAYCFSGGAHCCTTLFIATKCGSSTSLDMADLGHTDAKVRFTRADGAPGKLIRVLDWQFAYYGPEDTQIQLSFADSPAMTRLLVFDNGHWRVDRVGEFGLYYSRLLGEAVQKASSSSRRLDEEWAASLAIKAAYYSIMSGNPIERAGEVLNRLLPAKCKPEAGKIIQDIYRAAAEFDPVEAIR